MAEDPKPTPNPYVDPSNQAFELKAASLLNGKTITDLSLAELRKVFHEIQLPAPAHPGINITHFSVSTTHGHVKVFLYKPDTCLNEPLPLIFHVHGGGWIAAEAMAYERFIFDLVTRTGCALAFPEYTLAPAKKFPAQQEQCLDVLQYLIQHGSSKGLNVNKVVVTGDSAGGQLGPALSILSHQRSLDLPIAHQILLHPLVNSTSLTSTFSQFIFQNGPFLTSAFALEAFNDYFKNEKDRSEITASPILMSKDQAKKFMPPTTIVTAQCEWLRDQGQDFAKLLQTAGVACGVVQDIACIHDVEIFNIARDSPTAELIMILIAGKIREVFGLTGTGTKQHVAADMPNGKKRRRA